MNLQIQVAGLEVSHIFKTPNQSPQSLSLLKTNNPVGLSGRSIHIIFIKIFPFHVSTNVMYIDEVVRDKAFVAEDEVIFGVHKFNML